MAAPARSSLGQRGAVFLFSLSLLIVLAIMVSNLVIVLSTSRHDIPEMIGRINQFNAKIIEDDLWEMNNDRLKTDMAVLLNTPYVTWGALFNREILVLEMGTRVQKGRLDTTVPLYGRNRFADDVVGQLHYQINTEQYTLELAEQLLTNLSWQSLLMVILTVVTYAWLRRNVTKPLTAAAGQLEKTNPGNLHRVFVAPKKNRGDELDLLFATVEGMRSDLVREIKEHKTAERQIRQSLREREILTAELYHRTKNNMYVISSLLRLHGSSLKDAEAVRAFEEMDTRLRTMALVHEILYQSQDLTHVAMKTYLQELGGILKTGPLAARPDISLTMEIHESWLMIDTAIPLGLAVIEFLINSIRHAFPEGRAGNIQVRLLQSQDRQTFLEIVDDGVGLPVGFDLERDSKVGLQTAVAVIREQLRGNILFIREGGLRVQINFVDNLYSERV